MQLRQIKYILEVHRQGNHISAAAEALHTSQPGISKQVRLLELELGFDIFERTRNRIVGLTDPGREVIRIAQRIFGEIEDIQKIRDDLECDKGGTLTIATTHTLARYVLPKVITRFLEKYPQVQIALRQGNPTEACEYVDAGEADLAVGTDTMKHFLGLVHLPCFDISRAVVARKDHPILKVNKISLADLAKYPIIAHDNYRSGRWKIMEAFRKEGIMPNIPFTAVDSDVGKTYVELGLGIAIMASVAVDPKHDTDLAARDVSHLFESSTTYLSFRRSAYLRRFEYDFIEMLAPKLKRRVVMAAKETAEKEGEKETETA